jgi:hypothetical protein
MRQRPIFENAGFKRISGVQGIRGQGIRKSGEQERISFSTGCPDILMFTS